MAQPIFISEKGNFRFSSNTCTKVGFPSDTWTFITVKIYLTNNLHLADKISITLSEGQNGFIQNNLQKLKPVTVKLKRFLAEEIEALTKVCNHQILIYYSE